MTELVSTSQILPCLVALLAGLSMPAFGKRNSEKKKAFVHSVCRAKELKLKDCDLEKGPLAVGFSPKKIRFTIGPWMSIGDFPSNDKISEWKDVRIETLGRRSLISLKVWERQKDEITLEKLHWRILEPQERELHLLLDQVIGKRTLVKDGTPIQDPLKKTFLKVEKGKDSSSPSKIIWKAGDVTGVLKNPK